MVVQDLSGPRNLSRELGTFGQRPTVAFEESGPGAGTGAGGACFCHPSGHTASRELKTSYHKVGHSPRGSGLVSSMD